MLIDTHAHLEDRKFARDLDRVVSRARDAGVTRLVCIADDLASSRKALELTRRYPWMSATVGFHPQHERRYKPEYEAEIRKLARRKNVVAIGETGLDFHYPDVRRDRQIEILTRQAEIATEVGLPLVLHCRDAYPELIELFRREPSIRSRGVVHCFSGTWEDARALLDLGFYLGVGGTVTYPGGDALRETVKRAGLERLVSETDSPYLPPQKKRGRRNEPSYMKFTIKALADLTGYSYQDVARITTANAVDLYGLSEDFEPQLAYAVRDRLYLNVTNRCTNECCYCERFRDYMLKGHYLKLEGEPSAREILAEIQDPEFYEEFVICGLGEPTLRLEVVLELARELKARGFRVRLNTNGHGSLIHDENIAPKFAGLLDAIAITMNGHDEASYNEISCPKDEKRSFGAMLEFAREAKKYVPEVRMKLLALPGVDVEAARRIAEDDLRVRFQVRSPRPHGYPMPNGKAAATA